MNAKEQFLPLGYAKLSPAVRWQLLLQKVREIGIDETFKKFSKIARYQAKSQYADSFKQDLDGLMQQLHVKDCPPNEIFSRLSNRCIKDSAKNRKSQAANTTKLQSSQNAARKNNEEAQKIALSPTPPAPSQAYMNKTTVIAQLPTLKKNQEPELLNIKAYRTFYGAAVNFLTANAAKKMIGAKIIVISGQGLFETTKALRKAALQTLVIKHIGKDHIGGALDGVDVEHFYVHDRQIVTGSGADPVLFFK